MNGFNHASVAVVRMNSSLALVASSHLIPVSTGPGAPFFRNLGFAGGILVAFPFLIVLPFLQGLGLLSPLIVRLPSLASSGCVPSVAFSARRGIHLKGLIFQHLSHLFGADDITSLLSQFVY